MISSKQVTTGDPGCLTRINRVECEELERLIGEGGVSLKAAKEWASQVWLPETDLSPESSGGFITKQISLPYS